jgi:hypothetical protein
MIFDVQWIALHKDGKAMMIPGTFFGMLPQAAMFPSPFQKRLEPVKKRYHRFPHLWKGTPAGLAVP